MPSGAQTRAMGSTSASEEPPRGFPCTTEFDQRRSPGHGRGGPRGRSPCLGACGEMLNRSSMSALSIQCRESEFSCARGWRPVQPSVSDQTASSGSRVCVPQGRAAPPGQPAGCAPAPSAPAAPRDSSHRRRPRLFQSNFCFYLYLCLICLYFLFLLNFFHYS